MAADRPRREPRQREFGGDWDVGGGAIGGGRRRSARGVGAGGVPTGEVGAGADAMSVDAGSEGGEEEGAVEEEEEMGGDASEEGGGSGEARVCPVCLRQLQTNAGFSNHLAAHVRNGEMTPDERAAAGERPGGLAPAQRGSCIRGAAQRSTRR